MKLMIWNAARGGMRSVVEAYERDGFLASEDVVRIASYDDRAFLARQLLLLRSLCACLFYLATRRIELIHIHAAMRGSFWRKSLFAVLARGFGVPVILHLHGSEMKLFYESQSTAVQKLIRRQLEKATRVLVLSESWRSFILGIAPKAVVDVVPNYVTVPDVIDDASSSSQQILFLGLIGHRKGVFDLIPAFASIANDHPDAKLVIGGNGQIAEAGRLLCEHGVSDQVQLAGWVGPDEKAALLKSSSIYILPSYNEGLPMSVLEAMAAGLAVITTRVGGIPELITDESDGLLIDAGDRQAMAKALSKLLTDRSLRQRIAQAGRSRVLSRYSDKAILPLLHRIYAECKR